LDTINIEEISIKQLQELQEIGKQTFYETFSESNNESDMNAYFAENNNSEKLKNELNNPNSKFFFANSNQKPIGYLKLNFNNAQTEINDPNAMEIERIYVLKTFQNKKVGQILLDKAIEIAKQKKNTYIRHGVWEQNLKAIRFYNKNSFFEFDKHIFKLGNDDQTDLMMKRIIFDSKNK